MIPSTLTLRNCADPARLGQEATALPWQVAPCAIGIPRCRSAADFARGQYLSLEFFDTLGRAVAYAIWQDGSPDAPCVRCAEDGVYDAAAPLLARDYAGQSQWAEDGGAGILVVDPRLWVILYPIG
jgi:hypothetical protein